MLAKRMGSKEKNVLAFFLMLYPVLPSNYYISVFSYANISGICIVLAYVLGSRSVKVINIFKYNFLFWLYLVVYALFAMITSSFVNGFAWIVSEILVSIVIIGFVTSDKDIFRIMEGIIIVSLILSVIGIIESLSHVYLIQSALYEGWSDSLRYGILRCAGPFGHPINFGFYQAIAALLAFYRLNSGLDRKKEKIYRLAYALAIISMCLSVSRLAICFFVTAQIIMILLMGPRKVIKYMCLIALAVSGALIALDALGVESFKFVSDLLVSLGNLLGLDSGQQSSSGVVGFGNRFDLYAWVIHAVGKKWLFGLGVGAEFAYKMTDWFTKTSIEVHYLYIFYQCGVVGLCALVLSYIGNIVFFAKVRKYKLDTENKLSLGKVLLIIIVMYYICLFGIQETDLTRFHCELIALGIAYYRVCRNQIAGKRERDSLLNQG